MVVMSKISVIGAGYVGLVTAACFAELGHRVTLLEIDLSKLGSLEQGILPVYEPGLPELWRCNCAEGRLSLTSDYVQGLAGSEFVFFAVGTPSTTNGKPDLRWVRSAAESIGRVADGSMIVVIKSTVPVGTADLVAGIIARRNRNKHDIPVVSNPEFLREGLAVFDFMHPTRVVIGSANRDAADAVAGLYESLDSPIIMCDNKTAEMSKYASNVFLAARISFMNEIARLCDEYDVDVVQLAKVVGGEPRCGEGYLGAGLGWGGSCLPKDVKGLLYMAKNRGVSLPIVRAVQQINLQQPHRAVEKLRQQLGSLGGKTIGVLGLSFKPDSDDMRQASSLSVIPLLEEQGCQVKAHDPVAMRTAAKLMPNVVYCNNAYEVAEASDALLLVTEWDEFKKLDMRRLSSLMNTPILIDGRNFYDPDEMVQAGFIYEGIGRGKSISRKPRGILTRKKTERMLSGAIAATRSPS
jgi:UDPglucose 6-dehydrogenase